MNATEGDLVRQAWDGPQASDTCDHIFRWRLIDSVGELVWVGACVLCGERERRPAERRAYLIDQAWRHLYGAFGARAITTHVDRSLRQAKARVARADEAMETLGRLG